MKGKYRAVKVAADLANSNHVHQPGFAGDQWLTCMPGNLQVVGEPPMCVDAPSMQWFADAKAHKPKPTNTVPGITYHACPCPAAKRFRS